MKLPFEFVDDVRDAWRWASVRAMVLASVLIEAWDHMPASMLKVLPEPLAEKIGVTVLLLGLVGRLLKPRTKVPEQ